MYRVRSITMINVGSVSFVLVWSITLRCNVSHTLITDWIVVVRFVFIFDFHLSCTDTHILLNCLRHCNAVCLLYKVHLNVIKITYVCYRCDSVTLQLHCTHFDSLRSERRKEKKKYDEINNNNNININTKNNWR